MKALDFSVYSAPRTIEVDEWEQLLSEGYSLACCGLWTGKQGNPYALESLRNALAAGLEIQIYTALNGVQSGGWHVDKAIAQVWPILSNLSGIWIDVELDGVDSQQLDDAIGRAISHHIKPYIYTADWWWSQHRMWDFSHVPLVTAQYDNEPSGVVEYGGWSRAKGNIYLKQYSNDVELLPEIRFDILSRP